MRIPSVPKPKYEVILKKEDQLVKTDIRYSGYAAKHLAGAWKEIYDDTHTVEIKPPKEQQNGSSDSSHQQPRSVGDGGR